MHDIVFISVYMHVKNELVKVDHLMRADVFLIAMLNLYCISRTCCVTGKCDVFYFIRALSGGIRGYLDLCSCEHGGHLWHAIEQLF